jgi:hypothetical protein
MKKYLITGAITAICMSSVAHAAGNERIIAEMGVMQYEGDSASSTLTVRNTGATKLWRANFVCYFITEDFTPFDPQAIHFDDIPAKGKVSKKIVTDAGEGAYSLTCDLIGGRTYDNDGEDADLSVWFSSM